MKKRRDNEKIFLAVLLCGLFSMPLGLFAQEKTKVTLSRKAVTLNEVITEMKKQTSYDFFYSTELSELKQTFDIDVKDKEVRQVLDEILPPLGLEYAVQQNLIIIREKLDKSASKTMSVKGRVFDSQGASLPGVTVVVKGTTLGTSTDTEGRFELDLPAQDNLRLLFSFIGMESQELVYTGQEELDVVMKEDLVEIDEVVVTGMFDRRAESFTGSAVTVTQEQLRAVGNTNVIQSLRNLDPSFRIAENLEIGSNPNAMPEIQLRGQSGFPDLRGEYATNPNQPLFIVDGFEADLTKVIDMDMNRIASVTLLKDAAAKAIYGSKAANGVVVIETKRPEPGELRVTYTGTVTVNLPDMSSYELCNSTEKLQVELNAGLYDYIGYNGVVYWEDPNQQYIYSERYNDLLKETLRGVNTDWKAQPLRNAVGHKHVVYLEGGDEAFQYGIDFSFNNVVGVMKGSGRKTFSGGLTFSYRYKNLLLRDQLEVVYNRGDNSPWGDFSKYTSMNPYFRPYDENGNLIKTYTLYEGSTETNPMWNAMIKTKDMTEYSQFTNNFYAEWRAFEGFKASARIGLTRTDNGAEIFLPATHTDFATYTTDELLNRRGSYTYTDGYSFQLSADVNASYSKYFGNHLLMANAGWTLNDQTTKSMTMKAEGFPNDRLDDIGYARSYAEDSAPTSTESTVRDIGVVAAVNYSYADRYLFDGSIRFSGSSQFGSENRWGKFWSLGLGWNLHHEKFMASAEWLDQLKIRGSIGFTGSQNFNSYQSQDTWTYYKNNFYDGNVGAYLMGMANDRLKWQRKKDTDVGLEFTAFDSRLNIRLDYYNSITDDLLTDVTIPSSTGFTSYKENLGKVQNQGFEFYVNARVWENREKNGYVNIYVNGTHNTNKIKEISNFLASFNEEQSETVTNKPITRYEEGQSMTAIWAVPSRGIDPATGKDVFVKKNGRTTFEWNSDDLAVCGDTEAKLYGNFGFNFSYWGFIVNVGMMYELGGQIYNQTLVDKVENADLTMNVDRRIFSDRWAKPGDISRFKNIADNTTTQATERFVEDNNIWTLSTVNVSYDFDRFAVIKNAGFDRLRLSFDMADVARSSSVTIERGTSYPFARAFSFSLQAMF